MNNTFKSINLINKFWMLNFLFVFFFSIISIFIYLFLRQNLEINYNLLIISVIILIVSCLSPLAFAQNLRFLRNHKAVFFYPIISLLIFLIPIIGNFFNKIFYIYIILLIYIFLNYKALINNNIKVKQIIFVFIAAFFFSIFLINSINDANHAHFFSPEQMNLGVMNHDTRFHVGITHIIQNFNVSSVGTHGYLPLNYHYFINWYFAGFGEFFNLNPVWIISTIPFFLIIPLFFFFLFNSSASLIKYKSILGNIFVNLILILFILNLSGPFRNSIFISETYLISLTCLFALIPLLYGIKTELKKNKNISIFLFFLITFFPILISMKVSIGIFYGIFISWIIFRLYIFSKLTFFYSLIILLFFLVSYNYFVPSINDYVDTKKNPIDLFFYFKTFPGLYSLVPYLFIFLLLFNSNYNIKKFNFSGLLIKDTSTKILIEAILIISLLGLIMAIIGIPRNSSVWYFVNPCQWFAIPILVSYFLNKKNNISLLSLQKKLSLKKRFNFQKNINYILFFIFLSFYFNTTLNFNNSKNILKEIAYKANLNSNYLLFDKNESPGNYFKKNLSQNFTLFDKKFLNAKKNSVGSKLGLLNSIKNIDTKTAVYINPNEKKFWEFQSGCRTKFNIIPSVSGLATIYGSPPKKYGCGLNDYTANYGGETFSIFLSNEKLCAEAKKIKINKIIKLTNFNNKNLDYSILNCD